MRVLRLRAVFVLVLSSVLVVTGAVLSTRPPAAQAAPRPVPTQDLRVPLRAMSADDLRAATAGAVAPREGARTARVPGTSRSGVQSSAQQTGGGLRVIGVTWPAGELGPDRRVEYRTRDAGAWGAWTTMSTSDDHGPDPGSAEAKDERGGTDPYVVTSDAVQVRVLDASAQAPADVQLDVIDPSSAPADKPTSTAGSASGAGAKPTIYTRAQWGADESLRTGVPEYGTIKAGFVHHTVNANNYTASQVPAIIRGIYTFHTKSRGWSDIGYNFLVDRFGRTWEGRAGGVDQPVIGAHTGGFNSQLFGAAAIGTFNTATPPAAVVNAFSKLFAWKLSLAHVDPTATVTLDGMTRPISTVSGHRDADGAPNDTECPGNALEAKLPTIRADSRALMGAAFFNPRIDVTSWDYGQPVTTTVRANPDRTMNWTLQVRSVCSTAVLTTLRGTATKAAGLVASWNGTFGGALPPPGEYAVSVSASAGSGTANSVPPYTARVQINPPPDGGPPGYCPARIGGADRYDTAVQVARAANPQSQAVVLASGADAAMPDALVSAPLARAKGAAMLLTKPTSLPSVVTADLRARRVTTAYIVGGTGVISSAVEQQLRSLGVTSIDRVAGKNRYDTAAGVAARIGASPDVLVASGDIGSMSDGLVLSGPGSALKRPVLLVQATKVPTETRWALTRVGAKRTVVAGGTGVVSDAVVRALPSPRRVAGADRYATATAIGTWARGVMQAQDVVLSSGEATALVDTLSGGQLGRIMLYARRTVMPSATASWLDQAPGLRSVTVLGGTGAVNELVAGRAQQAVRS
ncbi:cell wall-binding repeat-containing protein [Knoellia koreensis]|uniref:Peptidoglycan recognition protein family domain-containing protein n=1 Tax=Knoellia koreensis TaxID=2730921 RepID=A0A849HP50_9MICO|nr:hypothetical protein [Knoellia sp. DB2414S]